MLIWTEMIFVDHLAVLKPNPINVDTSTDMDRVIGGLWQISQLIGLLLQIKADKRTQHGWDRAAKGHSSPSSPYWPHHFLVLSNLCTSSLHVWKPSLWPVPWPRSNLTKMLLSNRVGAISKKWNLITVIIFRSVDIDIRLVVLPVFVGTCFRHNLQCTLL